MNEVNYKQDLIEFFGSIAILAIIIGVIWIVVGGGYYIQDKVQENQTFNAKIVHHVDADSFIVWPDTYNEPQDAIMVRLKDCGMAEWNSPEGIALAPELGFLDGTRVKVEAFGKDKYDRVLARVYGVWPNGYEELCSYYFSTFPDAVDYDNR